MMPKTVDAYLADGCMRCKYGATPQCKVHNWAKELLALRSLALRTGLEEEIKWGMPCYTLKGKTVFIISAFKHFVSINFFKGILLSDVENILVKSGENTHQARQLRFTDIAQIVAAEDTILAYMCEAINIEESGKQIPKPSAKKQEIPEELNAKFAEYEGFKKAFESLTPGRQRGYLYFFAQAKKSDTRIARIEKCLPDIFAGKGLNER